MTAKQLSSGGLRRVDGIIMRQQQNDEKKIGPVFNNEMIEHPNLGFPQEMQEK